MQEMDDVFAALADPGRRVLLDSLYDSPGQTLGELCARLDMSRQGVSKHLALLEAAGLVVTRREGRSKYHYLNPVPIRAIYRRWIRKFDETQTDALLDLAGNLNQTDNS